MKLDGKVVLITGASEGIGAACAAAFRRRGARLALTARSVDKLKQAVSPNDFITPGDLTCATDRKQVVESTFAHYGTIDVLVNNAGVGLYSQTSETPPDSARSLFELNFFAVLDMIQLVAPAMRRQKSGCIVNVSSIAGMVTLPWFTLYSASKYALNCLTDGLRMELKQDGIQLIAVCPGYVKTGFQEHVIHGRPPARVGARRKFAITAEQCAEAIARGIERNSRTVVTPRSGWLFVMAARLFPSRMDALLERINREQKPF